MKVTTDIIMGLFLTEQAREETETEMSNDLYLLFNDPIDSPALQENGKSAEIYSASRPCVSVLPSC